ncbi:MAG: DUF3108 domain-containing protein [bacterium]
MTKPMAKQERKQQRTQERRPSRRRAAFAAAALSAALLAAAGAAWAEAPAVLIEPPDMLLVDGEKLSFDIYYGSLPAGHASLEVASATGERGDVWRISSSVRSNALVSLFFNVDDRVVSEMDARTLEPRLYEKHISEGRMKKHVRLDYGDSGFVAAGGETFRVEPGTRDVLSALYLLRGQDLRVGEDVIVRTFDNSKCYQARVRVLRREKVSTHRGEYQCLVVEPELEGGLKKTAGKLLIYLTDDALKLPVLMKSKFKVGSLVAELVEATHLAGHEGGR